MKYLARDIGLAVLALVLVHACGGGGGNADEQTLPLTLPKVSTTVASDQFVVDCSGNYCGAADEKTYSGVSVGAWFYRNSATNAVAVPVAISGLSGQTVTLVYTNESSTAVALPSLTLQQGVARGQGLQVTPTGSPDPAPESISARNDEILADIVANRTAYTQQQARAIRGAATQLAEGATRTITDPQRKSSVALTLRKRLSTLDGAYKVNLWVDDTQYGDGKMTDALIARFATAFAGDVDNSIYTMATGLAGKPWGEHTYTNLIDASQDLNIVFYPANGGGWAGYFAASDQIGKSWYATSNEWLALYVSSDGLATSEGSVRWAISTLAHEFTHMIHFYQRAVIGPQGFDLWLNEMIAMGMEDILGSRFFGEAYSTTRIMHYPNWLSSGNFNCRLDLWLGLSSVNGCNSYAVSGSFGAYLVRQYGVDFYRALFTSTESASIDVLDGAIRAAGGSGIQDALRRWGASLAMLPQDATPSGHGYPRLLDGGFDLAGFDGSVFASSRRLPESVPASLAPLAHFPLERGPLYGSYKETLTVPAGCSLSVIVN